MEPNTYSKVIIWTEYDEQGRSYACIDDEAWRGAQVQEWIGGIPDTWKRR